MEDLELERGLARVRRKGRGEPEWLELPEATRSALAEWLAVRSAVDDGGEAAARGESVFLALDRRSRGRALAPGGSTA